MLPHNQLNLLLFGGANVELFKLLADEVPVILLGGRRSQILHCDQAWIQCEGFFAHFYDSFSNEMHNFAN
jgi:hypothetical protein